LRDLESTFGMRPDARYKIMRDQAVAQGLGGSLPLFDDQPPAASDAPQQPSTASEPDDMIGFLQGFNSVPPGQLN
jgi:hypothetical protein